MQQYTSTEARKNFFKILDKLAQGEQILVDRNGTLMKMSAAPVRKAKKPSQNYRDCFLGTDEELQKMLENVEYWGWDYDPDKGLTFVDHSKNKKGKKLG